MTTISDFMGDDHQRCDRLFADAEQAAADGDWERASAACDAFLAAMAHHFAMEEGVLFPAFEQASGSDMGPTQVMRYEHEQMRGLFADMADAMARRNADDYLGSSETLLIFMQQHNAKEEQVLYPMSDRMLAPNRDGLMQAMQEMEAA